MKITRGKYIVPETGEVKEGTLLEGDPENIIIISKEAREAARRKLQQREERSMDERGKYIQALQEPNLALENELSLRLQREIMRLMIHASPWKKGLLVNRKTGKALSTVGVANVLRTHERDVRNVLRQLVESKVLIQVKNEKDVRRKNYCFNEEIYNIMGRKLKRNEYFTKVYLPKLEEVINRLVEITGDKTGGNAVGLLRVMLSYFHYQTYYLCANPNDDLKRDPELSILDNLEKYPELFEEIMYLSVSQLGRKAGISDNDTVKRYLDQLVSAGAIIVMVQSNGKEGGAKRIKRRVIVHPDLMFREDGAGLSEYTRSVKSLFSAMETKYWGIDKN